VQDLLVRCTSLKAEYTKATSMLLQHTREAKAKDERAVKLELANTRLQALCRALRGQQGAADSAAQGAAAAAAALRPDASRDEAVSDIAEIHPEFAAPGFSAGAVGPEQGTLTVDIPQCSEAAPIGDASVAVASGALADDEAGAGSGPLPAELGGDGQKDVVACDKGASVLGDSASRPTGKHAQEECAKVAVAGAGSASAGEPAEDRAAVREAEAGAGGGSEDAAR
jgi:hypothetical protein